MLAVSYTTCSIQYIFWDADKDFKSCFIYLHYMYILPVLYLQGT